MCDIMSWYIEDIEMIMCLGSCESYMVVVGCDASMMNTLVMTTVVGGHVWGDIVLVDMLVIVLDVN